MSHAVLWANPQVCPAPCVSERVGNIPSTGLMDQWAGSRRGYGMARQEGIEPPTFGLEIGREATPALGDSATVPENVPDSAPEDPSLTLLITSWPKLSEAMKAGILAMVKTVRT